MGSRESLRRCGCQEGEAVYAHASGVGAPEGGRDKQRNPLDALELNPFVPRRCECAFWLPPGEGVPLVLLEWVLFM